MGEEQSSFEKVNELARVITLCKLEKGAASSRQGL